MTAEKVIPIPQNRISDLPGEATLGSRFKRNGKKINTDSYRFGAFSPFPSEQVDSENLTQKRYNQSHNGKISMDENLHKTIGSLESDVKHQERNQEKIERNLEKIASEISLLSKNIAEKIEEKIDSKFQIIDAKLDAKIATFEAKIEKSAKETTRWSIGLAFAVIGIVCGFVYFQMNKAVQVQNKNQSPYVIVVPSNVSNELPKVRQNKVENPITELKKVN